MGTPRQTVSKRLHLVTQWRSVVRSTSPSATRSAWVSRSSWSTAPHTRSVHVDRSIVLDRALVQDGPAVGAVLPGRQAGGIDAVGDQRLAVPVEEAHGVSAAEARAAPARANARWSPRPIAQPIDGVDEGRAPRQRQHIEQVPRSSAPPDTDGQPAPSETSTRISAPTARWLGHRRGRTRTTSAHRQTSSGSSRRASARRCHSARGGSEESGGWGAEAVEEVAGDLLDGLVAAGEAVGPVGAAGGDDGAAAGRGVGAEHGVAVGDALDVVGLARRRTAAPAMNSTSDGSSGGGGRVAVVRVKCAAGAVPRISKSSGVPSAPVGYGRPSR